VAELIQRDAEAVGDGDQRLALAHGVKLCARRGRGGRRHRHDQRLDSFDAIGGAQLIGRGQRLDGDAILARHRGQRILGRHAMVAPRVALGFGDGRHALGEQLRGSRGQVQIE